MAKLSANQKAIQRAVTDLLAGQPDDQRLRDNLEGLARQQEFPGMTWFWGPLLYQRNRMVFRSFILQNFSDWSTGSLFRWYQIKWGAHADSLEPWLAAARRYRDTALVRRLHRWRYARKRGWGLDNDRWRSALCEAYRAAGTAAERAIVLEEFDEWFELDEATATALYAVDRGCSGFLLRHVPLGYWGGEKRTLWRALTTAAEQAGDTGFARALYRKLVPDRQWEKDVAELAASALTPEQLDAELELRHPEGYGRKRIGGMVKVLEARGREVLPYVQRHLRDTVGLFGSSSDGVKPLVKLARKRGWWDLWSAAIRAEPRNSLFNDAVRELCADTELPRAERNQRLTALAGVSREWNWPGFGLARVHALEDKHAAALYEREPTLVRGPFRSHVTPTWWHGYPKLLQAAQDAGDDDLVDLLASRYATRFRPTFAWDLGSVDRVLEQAEQLGAWFEQLRDRDPERFARRAANVLTRIPTFSIFSYNQLLKTNRLARLLFNRSFDSFLGAPRAVQDIVEGSDIHVQMLGYRILAQDDERAQALAVANLDLLLGTLLRPLHRKTRLPAFDALANAARTDPDIAARVLHRARAALRLPDRKYPKEELVGLLGRILHAWPALRSAAEQPVVYGQAEVTR